MGLRVHVFLAIAASFAAACGSDASTDTGSKSAMSGTASGASGESSSGAASDTTSGASASGESQGTSGAATGLSSESASGENGDFDSGQTSGETTGSESGSSGDSSGTMPEAGAPHEAGASGSASGAQSGDAGTTDSNPTTKHAICNFTSGLNVAWVKFAADVPNPSIPTFQTIFQNTFSAGGRVVRWWFHTDGSTTPGYQTSGAQNGMAQKIPQSHIDGVKSILSAAQAAGVQVTISLWSFDMARPSSQSLWTLNKALLQNDTNRQAYIDNYLTPLVTALKSNPGLYAYEIFNEPEDMSTEYGFVTNRTPEASIQRTVNWFAAAIHDADSTALVTNGAQTFITCSNTSGKTNAYSDSALRTAGGKQNGTLDFYEVHYYTQNGVSNSPFKVAASHWGLDKKLVIGEFFANADNDGVAGNNTYTYLYSNGYNGAWAWSYDADEPWPQMKPAMVALFSAHADVGTCP